MPTNKEAEPIYREDDRELLGYIRSVGGVWSALTTFGYEFGATPSREEAVRLVEQKGVQLLRGMWQYYDVNEQDWHPCIIKKAQFNRVTVMRTTSLGYVDIDHPGFIVIQDPDSSSLVSLL